jgi:phage tail protein X
MQRDVKVGVAVGLALVGIVGALFFRRDPIPEETPAQALQNAEAVDKEIAGKAKTPYAEETQPAPQSTATTETAPSFKPKAKTDAYEIPGFLNRKDQDEHQAILSSKKTAVPDPIAAPPGPARRDSDLPPAHNREWEPVGSSASPAAAPKRSTAGTADAGSARRTHVTQAGDTLSSIAAHYLGSGARFREIYEANRHVLRSPDDLPDGVTLVIPDSAKAGQATAATPSGAEPSFAPKMHKASSTTSHPAANSAEAAAPSGDQPTKLRFSPVGRGILNAGRVAPAPANVPATSSEPRSAPRSKPAQTQIQLDDSDPF